MAAEWFYMRISLLKSESIQAILITMILKNVIVKIARKIMNEKQELQIAIAMIKSQLKYAKEKHRQKLYNWLDFIEDRYDFLLFCEMREV